MGVAAVQVLHGVVNLGLGCVSERQKKPGLEGRTQPSGKQLDSSWYTGADLERLKADQVEPGRVRCSDVGQAVVEVDKP